MLLDKKGIKKSFVEDDADLPLKDDHKHRSRVLLSEMGACFTLTFLLLILHSLYIAHQSLAYYVTLGFIPSPDSSEIKNVMIGLYVFLDVLITILIFERWSCNANPSVSLYLFLTKHDSGRTATSKIFFQFIGAAIAGGLSMLLVNLTDPHDVTNDFTGFNNDVVFGFGNNGTIEHFLTGSLSIIIIEMLAAIGLCWSLLSKNINRKIGLISVLIYLLIAASAAEPTGVLSFNSARGFGPIIFHDIQIAFVLHTKLTIYNSELISYPFFFLSPFLGVYIYYSFTKVFDKSIIHAWFKAIGKDEKNS